MRVILDVNVILSALLKDSLTRSIILFSDLDFYFPETSIHKIRKYQDYILGKSGLNENEYMDILSTLFKYIKLIPTEEIIKNWKTAKRIMEHIDPEDVVFVAAALTVENSIIWSNDSDFERQETIQVLKTKDMLKLL